MSVSSCALFSHEGTPLLEGWTFWPIVVPYAIERVYCIIGKFHIKNEGPYKQQIVISFKQDIRTLWLIEAQYAIKRGDLWYIGSLKGKK